MVLRVVFLTGFLGLILIAQQRVGFAGPIFPFKVVLACGYFFSLIYALLFKIWRPIMAATVQMVGDLFVVGGIMFTTGGLDSPLTFLFLFVIIATSNILPRAACYLVASGASIIYGVLVDLEYFGIIQPINLFGETRISFDSGYGFYIISLNIASFYSVAFLSSILSHRLRVIKEELALKSIDLQALQAFHQNVVHNMGNGLITTDGEGQITSMNRAAEDISGYLQAESLGKPCFSVLSIPALQKFFIDPGSVGLPFEIQGECKRKEERTTFIRMKISRLSDHDESSKGYICVFEDLTEMKKMQEKVSQGEQLAAVGRFSAGLAHEIRNPLASLSGSIQVLNKGLKLDSAFQRLMGIVIKETERLNAIVSDFLAYSQPRKNRDTLVDLTQLIEEVIILMKNSEEYSSEIKIEFKRQADHLLLNCDEVQIKQTLWNLCINGIHSMSEGGKLIITLDREISEGGGDERKGIILSVEDQGCGIPHDKINNIFDPFYTTKENGVGLGLANVYQFVQGSGGAIDVKSEVGKGTRLTIFFPQEEPLLQNH